VATHTFTIPLGSVDLDALVTDDDFRREAERLLPGALTKIGEKAAEVGWTELQKSLRSIPGFKANSSSGEKAKFIREAGQKHRQQASAQERREVTDHLIHQLREMKRKAGESG
jgi:hypothetical protein